MELRRILYFGLTIVLLALNAQKKDFQEEVHLSLNTTNILVGETLCFSAFVYSNTSKKVSDLSSILYVELIDAAGSPVHQTKVALRNGRGSGNIYINPEWVSSTYRVVAYTRWMKNYNSFFEQRLLVLNPYNGIIPDDPIAGNPLQNIDGMWVTVDTYKPLQKISMDLGILEPSTLSITVKEASSLYYDNQVDLENPSVDMQSFEILPEYRYALVQGNVKGKPDQLDRLNVNMTMKGLSMQVAVAKTDSLGRFWMNYNPDLSAAEGLLRIQIDEDSLAVIEILEEFYEDYDSLPGGNMLLDSITIQKLITRSVNSQIQRSYEKKDKMQEAGRSAAFTRSTAEIYYLDDYTRFSSVRDTFIELIKNVGVSKSENNYKMIVRCYETPGIIPSDIAPLILLDGVKVTSEDILKQSPNDIEKIEVIPQYYFINDIVHKGLVSVHSFGRKKLEINARGREFPLTDYQSYSKEGYELKIDNRLPLYQSEIYWEPVNTHQGGRLILDFSTSRLGGNYEILVRGISKNGKAVNVTKRFKVIASDL